MQSSPLVTRDDDAGSSMRGGSSGQPSEMLPEEDPPLPDGAAPPGAVYAHTASSLYLFEPIGKKLSKVGDFKCLDPGNPDGGAPRADRVLDIALDRDGVMYGTSDHGFLSINATNASCRYVKKDLSAGYPNSLSFVPLGTVDTTKETLVGYQFDPDRVNHPSEATQYVRIDVTDGTITKVGTLNAPNAPDKYKSSGDMIALIRNGNRAYLTVKKILPLDAGIQSVNDYLAEVDPKTGMIKTILGDIKKSNLWGFGFWAGTGYGFDENGEILELNMTDGSAKVLYTLKEDGRAVPWYGAGVKTLAPTAPTK